MQSTIDTALTRVGDLCDGEYLLIQNDYDVRDLNDKFDEDYAYYFIGKRDIYGSYGIWKDKLAFLVELPINFDPIDYWEEGGCNE